MKSLFKFADWPLRVKLVVVLTTVAFVPLLVTAGLDLRQANARLLLDTEEHLQWHTAQLARGIDAVHARNRQMAAGLARMPAVLSYCRAAALDRKVLEAPARELLRLQQTSDATVQGAALLDEAGGMLLPSEPVLQAPDPRTLASLQAALDGNAAIGEVFANRTGAREPVLAYFAPVLHADGAVACVAALWVRTTAFAEVLRPAVRPGAVDVPGGHALLFDALGIQIAPASDGAALFHPSGAIAADAASTLVGQQRFGDRTGALLHAPLDYPGVHERAVAAKPDGALFTSVDPVERRAVFAVAQRLESVPWTVFAFFPEAKFEAELDRLRRQKVVIAATAVVIAIAIGVLFARHLLAPLAALMAILRRLAPSQRGTGTGKGRSDEFGDLARTIEFLAERVQAQAKELEQAQAALEQCAREHSAELEAEIAERRGAQAAVRKNHDGLQAAQSHGRSLLARLQMLDQVTAAIAAQHPTSSVYRVVLQQLEARMPIDFGCVCLIEGLQDRVVVASVGAKSLVLAEHLGLREDDTLEVSARELARAARGVHVQEPLPTSAHSPLATRLADAGMASQVLAPLQSEGRLFGLLVVARARPRGFSDEERDFLRQLGAHVALAARQMQLNLALKQAHDDLRQTQRSVMHQERLRALGQMASGIAHDINNAISPVALYAESLLECEQHLSERGRRHLGTISRAIDDVAATVSRMREFYRQRNEPQAMAPVALDVLVQQVVDLTRARWSDMPQQRGIVIQLQTEFTVGLPPVMGVESELREALINVVLNAVDAMPDGGVLAVRTRSALMLDAAERETARICVDVADTGIGMGPNTRLHCLEPFFTTKGERGTGLGLAMVFGAMQRHQGEIEIDSEQGLGTTVSLVFPTPAASHDVSAPCAAMNAPLPPQHILVIDDDPSMLRSLGDTLESDGHHVVTAGGGQPGIDAFALRARDRPFDLVITDLGMPYVDGRKVASAIKALGEATPVIMLTGWGERMLATADIPSQVDLLLGKPIRLHDLRSALGRLISRRHPATETSKEET